MRAKRTDFAVPETLMERLELRHDRCATATSGKHSSIYLEAADRIKELETAKEELATEYVKNVNHLGTRIKELEATIERLKTAHKKNADAPHHKWKHQEDTHRCGWRVLFEAVVERSKAALKDMT